jgi:hypothetical protein
MKESKIMATNHTFKVAKSEGAAQHDVAVKVPTFKEATEKQRENAWNEAIRSITIKVQGTLRRRLAKGIKPGEALNGEAQRAFDAILNGTALAPASTIVDAAEFLAGFDLKNDAMRKLARGQVDLLTARGATVVNVPKELV